MAHQDALWNEQLSSSPQRTRNALENDEGSPSHGRFGRFGRRWAQRLSEAVNHVGSGTANLGESLNRSALSAGELVSDAELRRKGADVVITGARATLQDLKRSIFSGAGSIKQGLSRGIQGASSGLASGPRQMQSVLARVQHRIQQQRLRIALRAAKDDLVDVQIGPELYEEAPQELRARLWYALVENPGIGMAAFSPENFASLRAGGGGKRPVEPPSQRATHQAQAEWPWVRVQLLVNMSNDVRAVLEVCEPGAGRSERAEAEDDEAADLYHQICMMARQKMKEEGLEADAILEEEGSRKAQASGPSRPSPRLLPEECRSPWAAGLGDYTDTFMGDWEMVQAWADPNAEMMQPAEDNSIDSILTRFERGAGFGGGGSAEELESTEARQKFGGLLRAIWEVEWPIPTAVPPDSRYATLLQISIGQEDVDEVITRDIHRTFPEHPQFGLEDVGQAALFNVLKAYSLHDLEVGYCQGMAFVAGILLMYLPEEPAFKAFCLLMDENGPDLRRFYLPGLEGLKHQLAVFEELLRRIHPGISRHLDAHGIPPMLYASQWFLTAFACPFPASFSARVIDVMLSQHSGLMLMRTALAVMAECEIEVVNLDDFEEIITHLKVEPCQWGEERTREVLNCAVHSFITEDDIEDAMNAVRPDRGAAGASEPSEQRQPSQRAAKSAVEQLVRQVSFDREMAPRDEGRPGGPSGKEGAAIGEQERDAKLWAQQAEMDEEYMAMVLAMDMMLGGEGEGEGE